MVIVWIQAGAIALTQRVDWPQFAPQPASSDARGSRELGEWAHSVVHAARHVHAQGAVVLGYPSPPSAFPEPGAHVLAAVGGVIRDIGVEVLDALLVGDDGWWALDADLSSGGCAVRPFDLRITAEVSDDFMYAGWSHAADRDEVCAEFVTVGHARVVTTTELHRLGAEAAGLDLAGKEQWREDRVRQLVAACEMGSAQSADFAHLAVGLLDIRVRDCLLWHLAQQLDAVTSLRLMRSLLRELPLGHRAPAATVAAICAWLAGDGVRASAALDIAVGDEPGYGLARLVSTALANGLPPRMWQETMEQLSYDDCRLGLR